MNSVNAKFTNKNIAILSALGLILGAASVSGTALAQAAQSSGEQAALASPEALASRATYVDLVSLAERSALVVRAQIRGQAQLKPERAPGLAPGFARLYIEADTLALIGGNTGVGESLVYLVDVPLDAKGKAPKLKKREMLLFANAAGQGPKGETQLQLTAPTAQLAYSAAFETRVRNVLTQLVSADQPPVITGISEALAVPGTLVGESETQIFLTTEDRSPVSMTVLRRPGQPAVWGVSWGEIIDSAARAPTPETLTWFRLACTLPESLPSGANLARDPQARRLAARDYAFVIETLGPCARAITKTPPA